MTTERKQDERFNELTMVLSPRITGYLKRCGYRDEHAREDLSQETLRRLFQFGPWLDREEQEVAFWCFTTAGNLLRDKGRANVRHELHHERIAARLDGAEQREHLRQRIQVEVPDALASLPLSTEEKRLLEFVAQGFSYQKIANITGQAKSTVCAKVAKLRAKLSEHEALVALREEASHLGGEKGPRLTIVDEQQVHPFVNLTLNPLLRHRTTGVVTGTVRAWSIPQDLHPAFAETVWTALRVHAGDHSIESAPHPVTWDSIGDGNFAAQLELRLCEDPLPLDRAAQISPDAVELVVYLL